MTWNEDWAIRRAIMRQLFSEHLELLRHDDRRFPHGWELIYA